MTTLCVQDLYTNRENQKVRSGRFPLGPLGHRKPNKTDERNPCRTCDGHRMTTGMNHIQTAGLFPILLCYPFMACGGLYLTSGREGNHWSFCWLAPLTRTKTRLKTRVKQCTVQEKPSYPAPNSKIARWFSGKGGHSPPFLKGAIGYFVSS